MQRGFEILVLGSATSTRSPRGNLFRQLFDSVHGCIHDLLKRRRWYFSEVDLCSVFSGCDTAADTFGVVEAFLSFCATRPWACKSASLFVSILYSSKNCTRSARCASTVANASLTRFVDSAAAFFSCWILSLGERAGEQEQR